MKDVEKYGFSLGPSHNYTMNIKPVYLLVYLINVYLPSY